MCNVKCVRIMFLQVCLLTNHTSAVIHIDSLRFHLKFTQVRLYTKVLKQFSIYFVLNDRTFKPSYYWKSLFKFRKIIDLWTKFLCFLKCLLHVHVHHDHCTDYTMYMYSRQHSKLNLLWACKQVTHEKNQNYDIKNSKNSENLLSDMTKQLVYIITITDLILQVFSLKNSND